MGRQLYIMHLDDPAKPGYCSFEKPYFGFKEEFLMVKALMEGYRHLADGWTNVDHFWGNKEMMLIYHLSSVEVKLNNILYVIDKQYRIPQREKMLNYLENLPLHEDVEVYGRKYRLLHGKNPSRKRWLTRSNEQLKNEIIWERVNCVDSGPEGISSYESSR